MDNLTAMGYDVNWRKDVLQKAMVGYMKVLKNAKLGKTERNRTSASTACKRRYDKLCGSSNWYLEEEKDEMVAVRDPQKPKNSRKRDNRRVESVMFFPLTQGGALRKSLNEMEREAPFRSKFKYVETTGKSLIGTMGTLDPWATECGREDCFSCKSDPGKCMTHGVVYEVTCQRCLQMEKETKYYGDSARCSYNRGGNT